MDTVVLSEAVTLGYERGDPTRMAILQALADAPAGLTYRGVADAVRGNYTNIRRHLLNMRDAGLVAIEHGLGQPGATVTVTEAGLFALRAPRKN